MNNTDTGTHPITTHVRDAAEQIRLANHATHTDHRNVTEIYDTITALHTLFERLPHLLGHLLAIVAGAEPGTHYHDTGGNVTDALQWAEAHLADAITTVGAVCNHLATAASHISHLGTITTDD